MDSNLIEKYKQEMLNMQRISKTDIVNPAPDIPEPKPAPPIVKPIAAPMPSMPDGEGKLSARVTAIRQLYPIPNAKVTVFEGDADNMIVIDSDFTDQSGRTKDFILPTPKKELSLESSNMQLPYALYSMLIQADGYIDNIHLNIPVFSGITSIQSSDMMLLETAGIDKGPRIYDEFQQYTL